MSTPTLQPARTPPSSNPLQANWTAKSIVKGVTLYLGVVVGAVTVLGVVIAAFEYFRSSAADQRQDLDSFRSLISQAEQLYCEQQSQDEFTYDLKRILDRAQQLLPSIKNRMLCIDYLTIAAVGSEVLDPKVVEKYASCSVDLCVKSQAEASISSDDAYAAYITRGHIRFRLYCETGEPKVLKAAQEDFDAALAAKGDKSSRSKQLRGEAWLKRGALESYCGEAKVSDDCYLRATSEWEGLPHGKYLLNKIDLSRKQTINGMRPMVECPAQLTLASSSAAFPDELAPATVQAAPLPPGIRETMERTEHSDSQEIAELTKALLVKLDRIIDGDSDSKVAPNKPQNVFPTPSPDQGDNGEASRPPAPSENGSKAGMTASLPIDPQPPMAQSNGSRHPYFPTAEFDVINNLKSHETIRVAGFPQAFRLAPGQKVNFKVNYGDISLTRISRRRRVEFPKTIFWDDVRKQQNVPLIEITNCCFRLIKAGHAPQIGVPTN